VRPADQRAGLLAAGACIAAELAARAAGLTSDAQFNVSMVLIIVAVVAAIVAVTVRSWYR